MTIDEIVKAFSSIKKGTFPLKALNEAIDKQEEITPFLLDYIQKTPAEIDADFSKALSEDHASYYWDFSMHLLAQFKESTAFPHIVNFYTHKDQEMVDVVSGDFTTERLPAVLASTFNGDVETLFSVFDDQDIDAFVRGSFLRASIILVLHDVLDHEEMRDRYISLFKQGIEANDYDLVSRLVAELCDLGDPMLRPYIDEAFTKDLVETFIMDKASVDRAYKKPLTKENHFYKLVTDTHAELKGWVWFREEEELSRFKPSTLDAPLVDSFNDQLPLFSNERPAPVVRGSPKVGRNDPCPCGSGKKYKKCCLH